MPEVTRRDLVRVCSFCGAPCLGTYRFWFVDQQGGDGIEVDRWTLDQVLDALVSMRGVGEYATLPDVVRGLDEVRLEGPAPVVVDPVDLALTLDLLGATGSSAESDHLRHVLSELKSLLTKARAARVPLLFDEG